MKQTRLKPIGITLLVSFVLAFSACKKTEEDKIIGTWERTLVTNNVKGEKDTLIFDETKVSGKFYGQEGSYYHIENKNTLLIHVVHQDSWWGTSHSLDQIPFKFISNKEMHWDFYQFQPNPGDRYYQLTKL